MPNIRDIELFAENLMDRTNIHDFYNGLPMHLRPLFRAGTKTEFNPLNVLQGYRGPSHLRNGGSGDSQQLGPVFGVQEIRHWWGFRKDVNAIPLLGSIFFGAVRLTQKIDGTLEWNSIFFDDKTGEWLGCTKNEAANRLNEIGNQLFESQKFSEALEYYKNASNICSTNSVNRSTYLENMQKAQDELDAKKLNDEGSALLAKGEFEKAFEKFRDAYLKSGVKDVYDRYRENKELANTEMECLKLNSEGERLYLEGKYVEAKEKFAEAMKSKFESQRNKYINNAQLCEDEIQAQSLSAIGDEKMQESLYEEAVSSYEQAYNRSKVERERAKYESLLNRSKSEVEAGKLNSEGHQLFEVKKFTDAAKKYEEAYKTSQCKSEVYLINKMKAKAELAKNDIPNVGDRLFDQGKYVEAVDAYNEASSWPDIKVGDKIDKCLAEIDAASDNRLGEVYMSEGKYKEALDKFQQALGKTKASKHIEEFSSNVKKARETLNNISLLETFWKDAWKAENNDNSDVANRMFHQTLSHSLKFLEVSKDNEAFVKFENLARLKIKGNELFNSGILFHKEAIECIDQQMWDSARDRLDKSKVKLGEAIEVFALGSELDKKFSSSIDCVQNQVEVVKSVESGLLYSKLQSLEQETAATTAEPTSETLVTENVGNLQAHI